MAHGRHSSRESRTGMQGTRPLSDSEVTALLAQDRAKDYDGPSIRVRHSTPVPSRRSPRGRLFDPRKAVGIGRPVWDHEVIGLSRKWLDRLEIGEALLLEPNPFVSYVPQELLHGENNYQPDTLLSAFRQRTRVYREALRAKKYGKLLGFKVVETLAAIEVHRMVELPPVLLDQEYFSLHRLLLGNEAGMTAAQSGLGHLAVKIGMFRSSNSSAIHRARIATENDAYNPSPDYFCMGPLGLQLPPENKKTATLQSVYDDVAALVGRGRTTDGMAS